MFSYWDIVSIVEKNSLTIVAISDTHNQHSKLVIPPSDILIHSGDWTYEGKHTEVVDFAKWLEVQPAKNIVITPGNHELYYEKFLPESRNWITDYCPRAKVLIDEEVTVEGLRIYGSPITPEFNQWAFNRYRGSDIKKHWDLIPEGLDILITHGPAYGILDYAPQCNSVGCQDLFDAIQLKSPKIHISGHIHWSYGVKHFNNTTHYNTSVCTEQYRPTNPVTIIEIDNERT